MVSLDKNRLKVSTAETVNCTPGQIPAAFPISFIILAAFSPSSFKIVLEAETRRMALTSLLSLFIFIVFAESPGASAFFVRGVSSVNAFPSARFYLSNTL
jgi:hypothetical protein